MPLLSELLYYCQTCAMNFINFSKYYYFIFSSGYLYYIKRLVTIALFILLSQTFLSAQENNKEKKIRPRKQNKILMKEQIKHLKDGVLLVRLYNRENSITALNDIKQFELADKIRMKQENYNRKVI